MHSAFNSGTAPSWIFVLQKHPRPCPTPLKAYLVDASGKAFGDGAGIELGESTGLLPRHSVSTTEHEDDRGGFSKDGLARIRVQSRHLFALDGCSRVYQQSIF